MPLDPEPFIEVKVVNAGLDRTSIRQKTHRKDKDVLDNHLL